MNPHIENHLDRTASATPGSDRFGPGLRTPLRTSKSSPARHPERNVMNTLLGENNLVALDENGKDPYNATGRQFRR